MGDRYRVIYTGQLRLGTEKSEAIENFRQRFKVSEEKARKVLAASREITLKKELDKERAEKYRQALESIGMIVRLELMEKKLGLDDLSLLPKAEAEDETEEAAPYSADSPTVASLDKAPESAATPTCPKCGSETIEHDTCQSCGIVIPKYLARQAAEVEQAGAGSSETKDPYAAPQAELVGEVERGELADPITRPIGNGWKWIARGFWHFKQNPLAWIIAVVVWVVLSVGLSLVPFVGSLVITLLSPVILAGLMLGSAAQEHGDDFEISHLFSGFSSSVGQLVLVGLLYLIGFFLIMVVVGMVSGGVLVGMMGGMDAMQNPDPSTMQSAMGVGSILLISLMALGLSIPLMMAYWFAPALISMEGMSALSAMKLSFSGCLKNILPFLLYGIVGIVLFFIGAIPVGLGLLVVMPVMTASMYTSYRDIYYA
ncbi:BPSS1780 family membrane protein [Sedimenticola sp.]|uniref:BPSS1780 family membrane protein n=1 Tax=Sedimenticola sp. TaxID=1940285 RepID=UPI003D134A49